MGGEPSILILGIISRDNIWFLFSKDNHASLAEKQQDHHCATIISQTCTIPKLCVTKVLRNSGYRYSTCPTKGYVWFPRCYQNELNITLFVVMESQEGVGLTVRITAEK